MSTVIQHDIAVHMQVRAGLDGFLYATDKSRDMQDL